MSKTGSKFFGIPLLLALAAGSRANAQITATSDTVRDLARRSVIPLVPAIAPVAPSSGAAADAQAGLEQEFAEVAQFSLRQQRRWHIHPQLNAGVIYDSNVLRMRGGGGDTIYSAGGAVAFDYGFPEAKFYLTSHYGIAYDLYEKFHQQNGHNQELELTARWQPGGRTSVISTFELRDGIEENYLRGSPQQTTTVAFRVSANHRLTDNVSWGVDGNIYHSDTAIQGSAEQEDANLHVDYLVTPKFRVGFSAGGGLRSGDSSESERYNSARLRVNWQLTGKLSVSGSLGADLRQRATNGTVVTPSGEIGLQHHVSDNTQLHLFLYSQVQLDSGSAGGENLNTYGATFGVTQRLPYRMVLNLAGGAELASSTGGNGASSRDSEVLFVQTSVGWQVFRHMNAFLSYRFFTRIADGSNASIGYDQSQVSLGLGYSF